MDTFIWLQYQCGWQLAHIFTISHKYTIIHQGKKKHIDTPYFYMTLDKFTSQTQTD